mgnify:CR=1 FL=1|tara:strand:- start:1812 stop:2234 length:423 start_codon:yes stop_codon:yes gene_type:complete
MSSREYFRPFTRILTLSSTATSAVTLTDTANSSISCNYVSVEAVSGAGTTYFLAVPSGINVTNSYLAASDVLGNGTMTSGINGLMSSNNGGSVVFGLAPYDKIDGLILSQADDADVTYVINYGNVNVANIQQDNRNNIGN